MMAVLDTPLQYKRVYLTYTGKTDMEKKKRKRKKKEFVFTVYVCVKLKAKVWKLYRAIDLLGKRPN